MSDQPENRQSLISGGAILLVLLAIVAWSSNPNEASFRDYVSREVSQASDSTVERVAAKLLTRTALGTLNWHHVNYGFFSVVTFPDENVRFLGAFGNWTRLEDKKTK